MGMSPPVRAHMRSCHLCHNTFPCLCCLIGCDIGTDGSVFDNSEDLRLIKLGTCVPFTSTSGPKHIVLIVRALTIVSEHLVGLRFQDDVPRFLSFAKECDLSSVTTRLDIFPLEITDLRD